MHALIVHAHPEPRSFNAAMTARAVATLSDIGWTVAVSDLHAMGFDPAPRATDFTTPADPSFFKYQAEQAHAAGLTHGFAADIQTEIERVLRADLLILQFPLWWFSVPAILKGWIDRVFAMGVLYGGAKGFYSRGVCRGKRAMLAFTTGGPPAMYGPTGLNGDLRVVLWPLENGVLNFVGYDVLPSFMAAGPARADAATRAAMLDGWAKRLRTLDATAPLDFHDLDDFDSDGGWALRPGIAGRTVGQPGVG